MFKHTLLIVDDDKLILNTLKKKFETIEFNVFAASDPQEAKEVMEKYRPDLVILDLLLTRDDGSQGILDYLKSRPDLESVPVIALTNLDKPELKEMLLRQGVREYLIKGSLDLDALYAKVKEYVAPVDPS
jgi:DNA-binding response OmpR family regulator